MRLPSTAQVYWYILNHLKLKPKEHLKIINEFLEAIDRPLKFDEILIGKGVVELKMNSRGKKLTFDHPWKNLYLFYPILLRYQASKDGVILQNSLVINSNLPSLAWIYNSVVINSNIVCGKSLITHAIIINSTLFFDGVLEVAEGYIIGSDIKSPSVVNWSSAPDNDLLLEFWQSVNL